MTRSSTVSLADKYEVPKGRVFMTGTQALVRLMLAQKARDEAAGLNTGGFVSGYRGSPLGSVDQEMWKAKAHLESNNVVFTPGLNEELAATAAWGTQMVSLDPKAKVDGVFAMWYGKGPGVDRSGDASSTPTSRAHRSTAACWRSPAMTIPASPRPCHTRASRRSLQRCPAAPAVQAALAK